ISYGPKRMPEAMVMGRVLRIIVACGQVGFAFSAFSAVAFPSLRRCDDCRRDEALQLSRPLQRHPQSIDASELTAKTLDEQAAVGARAARDPGAAHDLDRFRRREIARSAAARITVRDGRRHDAASRGVVDSAAVAR